MILGAHQQANSAHAVACQEWLYTERMNIKKTDFSDVDAAEDFKWIGAFFGLPLVVIGTIGAIIYLLVR